MVRRDEFTHGHNFASRISAVGFNWSTAGENIAVGYTTPASVVQAWMASLGHCQNILYPAFSQIGTGVLDKGITRVRRSFHMDPGLRSAHGSPGPVPPDGS